MTNQDSQRYHALYRIRRFDEMVLENFPKGVFFGTTHTYLGQEANAVGVLSQIGAQDIVFSNHRCHGHFLAYGGDPRRLFAELMGRVTGVCAGRGGSQHLHWKNFFSNGVQGGIIPIATGMALAEKIKNTSAVAVAFLGDGTLGEGVIYEAFNMASLWGAPILYVLENNRLAQTTPVHQAVSGSILARFAAFDIQGVELDTSDVLEILPVAGELLADVRKNKLPRALILNTYRFGPHSKGDDTRSPADLHLMRLARDPITIQAARLAPAQRDEIESQVNQELEIAYQQALSDPFPEASEVLATPKTSEVWSQRDPR